MKERFLVRDYPVKGSWEMTTTFLSWQVIVMAGRVFADAGKIIPQAMRIVLLLRSMRSIESWSWLWLEKKGILIYPGFFIYHSFTEGNLNQKQYTYISWFLSSCAPHGGANRGEVAKRECLSEWVIAYPKAHSTLIIHSPASLRIPTGRTMTSIR